MKKYSKAIAAGVMFAATLAAPYVVGADASTISQAVLALLGVFGVYQVSNTTPTA